MDMLRSQNLKNCYIATLDIISELLVLLPTEVVDTVNDIFDYCHSCRVNNLTMTEQDLFQMEKFLYTAQESVIVAYGRLYIEYVELSETYLEYSVSFNDHQRYEWLNPNTVFDIFTETKKAFNYLNQLKHFITINLIKSRGTNYYSEKPINDRVVNIDFTKGRSS